MKCIILAALILVASAEPPRFFNRQFQRQQQAEAPYPPSGWRPAGAEFRLPARQQEVPQTVYGPPPPNYGPPPSYGPPPQEYGPPEAEVTTQAEAEPTTTEYPTTTESVTESARLQDDSKKSEKLQEERGVYYLYHPNGYLQRVVFSTKNDIQNMAYTAQIKYQDVEPIRDPVYTYDPATLTFSQVQT